jgi:hypothetical protein
MAGTPPPARPISQTVPPFPALGRPSRTNGLSKSVRLQGILVIRSGFSAVTAPVQNRRNHQRFSIEAELQYRSPRKGKTGTIHYGMTINLSSRGALFLAGSHSLEVGDNVRLTIPWPVQVGDGALQLFAAGVVIRIEGDHVAVKFLRCSFEPGSIPRRTRCEGSSHEI